MTSGRWLTRVRQALGKRRLLLSAVAAVVLAFAGIWSFEKATGASVFVRFSSLVWIPVSTTSSWLPHGMRLALQDPPPEAAPGALRWRELEPGFDVGELAVNVGGEEVDRLLLARIDPARFRFAVHTDPQARRGLDGWMRSLDAVLVVNGSYFARTRHPSTPVVSEGRALGPASYDGVHGAFVASRGRAELRDLAGIDWRQTFADAENALVSYPLLLAADGSHRVPAGSGWLANRSFIGEDAEGRIIIGSTKSGFFTLTRLAVFLRDAPIGLTEALNLDGGPVACQGIAINGYRRRHCGLWELQLRPDGSAQVLPASRWTQAPMPIVIAVYPREN
jgi:hypothetical protein